MTKRLGTLVSDAGEIAALMRCAEGRGFIELLASSLDAKHQNASDGGRRSAYYTERKALAVLAKELSAYSSGKDVTEDALRAALAKVASANAQFLKSAFEVADSAFESGFCSGEGFFAWFGRNRALLAEMLARSKVTAEALLGGSYGRILLGRVDPSPGKPSESHIRAIESDAANEGCQAMLEEFLETEPPLLKVGNVSFFERFSESIGFSPESYADLSVDTFDSQLRFFAATEDKSIRKAAISQLKRFYVFAISKLPEDQDAFTFRTGLTKETVTYMYLADKWLEGYRAVTYSPLDPPPSFPKWILFPNEDETRHSSFVAGNPQAVDASAPADFQALLIAWLWSKGDSARALRYAGPYCSLLASKVVEAGHKDRDSWRVEPKSVLDALAPYRMRAPKQVRGIKGYLRSFLEFAEAKGAVSVSPSCWLLLETTRAEKDDNGESGIDALSREETGALAKEIESRIDRSLADKLVYIVFCTQALTPLRHSEIVTLRIGDIVDGAHSGHHAVERTTKADAHGKRRIQIPRRVHQLLMAAEEATQELRESCGEDVREYLFLVPSPLRTVCPLREDTYRNKIIDAGKACGIEGCVPSRLRKRYMTEMVEQGLKHNLSRLVVNRLTNHAAEDIVNKHYLREDIRNYLEATHGILIGNPRIPGDIVEDGELAGFGAEDEVERGCGYCRNDDCNVAGAATCLICSGFLTSPQFIPQMEESLTILQIQIERAPSDHDRQHLVAVKRLLLAYLGKLLELKEERHGEE